MTLEKTRLNSAPKWVNPCGVDGDCSDADPEVTKLSDVQLLKQIVIQAKTALSHAKRFREDFIQQTFKTGLEEFNLWKYQRYDWLPSVAQIPKHLGEELDKEYLDHVELNTVLLDTYEYLQKFAVGVEQIVWDQEDQQLQFQQHFSDTENQLRLVLCEIQVALLEKGIHLKSDVTRDAMPSELRSMSVSRTDMNSRDWLIFRDYMNGLEYVIQVFEYLLMKLER